MSVGWFGMPSGANIALRHRGVTFALALATVGCRDADVQVNSFWFFCLVCFVWAAGDLWDRLHK